jgi:hypothetical protein
MKNSSLIALAAILLLWSQSSNAYIDPGSGSAIMSAIIGFFVAAGILVKTYWYKLKSLFGFGSKKSEPKSTDSDEQ